MESFTLSGIMRWQALLKSYLFRIMVCRDPTQIQIKTTCTELCRIVQTAQTDTNIGFHWVLYPLYWLGLSLLVTVSVNIPQFDMKKLSLLPVNLLYQSHYFISFLIISFDDLAVRFVCLFKGCHKRERNI